MSPASTPNPAALPSRSTSRPARTSPLGWLVHLWHHRWGLLRLTICILLLALLIGDSAARVGRMALARLDDAAVAPDIDALRQQGRFTEALLLADDALTWLTPGSPAHTAVVASRAAAAEEQSSISRRLRDVGRGALTGEGDSLESLFGAIGTDLFIIGDIRDLLIQGARFGLDGKADPVIAALSAVGIATTLAPQIDWAPSLLKAARKLGTLSAPLAEQIVKLSRAGTDLARTGLTTLFGDVATLARRTSPAAAARLLRFADSPEDVAKLARFAERQAAAGAPARGFAALHLTGEPGARLLKESGEAGDALLTSAAKKGAAGSRFLASPAARAMLRPHPILGLLKGFYKGNVQRAIQHALDLTTFIAPWLIAASAAWLLLELHLLRRPRAGQNRPGPRPKPHTA